MEIEHSNTERTEKYNGFSGIDIKATFGHYVVGCIQAIKFSISREMAPIYTMGNMPPRPKRIAGSLVFAQFDTEPMFKDEPKKPLMFTEEIDDLRPLTEEDRGPVIPPFDIVMAAANEEGDLSIMKLLGCQLVGEDGKGVRVDDLVAEHSFAFTAEGMLPWEQIPRPTPVEPTVDEHKGMVYNEYTGRWVWL